MDTDLRRAEIVFYRITSSHSRNRILLSLLKAEYGKKYDRFWSSLMKLIRQLDQTRNSIVHWSLHTDNEDHEDDFPKAFLAPHGDSEECVLSDRELKEFIDKAEFVRLQAIMFYIFHLSDAPSEDRQLQAQLEVFLRPVIYPPPPGYPGFHFGEVPRTPPESSGE